jgi:TolA-binding protein
MTRLVNRQTNPGSSVGRGGSRLRLRATVGLLVLLAGGAAGNVRGQETDESAAFSAAVNAFQDGIYDRAGREFEAFVGRFPKSSKLPEVFLFQARSALKQQQLTNAVNLLTAHMAEAGSLGDQYQYWLAEAQMEGMNYLAAAETFARLARDFPTSVRLLEAGYGEALARYKMQDWPKVVSLLQAPEGTFQKAVKIRANDELVARGYFLLAEALLDQKQFGAAEQTLADLGKRELIPEFKWRRQYLLCRVLEAAKRPQESLLNTTNLIALAAATGQRVLQAESFALQGTLLEELGRLDAAIQAFERNLAEGMPLERRRQALLKTIQLSLDQDQIPEATQKLETFFARYPDDAASDVGLLTYGEVQLKQAWAKAGTNTADFPLPSSAALTNFLQTARAQFGKLITNYPKSALVGKAWLDLGWSFWLEGNVPDSLAPFQNAVANLPFAPDKAQAQFKLADAQFYLKDDTNALNNYRGLLRDFVEVSEVRHGLFDHALYQVIKVSLELDDLNGATEAMNQLIKEIPESPFADRAMMLVAQSLSQAGKSAAARGILSDCLKRYAGRTLAPEIELALARTYVEDQNWSEAINRYDAWLSRHPTNELVSRAEFNRAWANYRAGHDTNAFSLFTNFLARFPTHELAPRARLWIGDYYLSRNDDFNAQYTYQNTNLLASPLSYLAHMMAGRAAFAGGRWKDAISHFTYLLNLNDNECPSAIRVEAFFGLGDTFIRQVTDRDKPLQKFEEAIEVFGKIPQLYPNAARVPQAWVRIGQCYFAIGELNPKHYESATNAFLKALAFPNADLATRTQAELGLGLALERMAKLRPETESTALARAALDHYLNIVYGTSPVLRDGEKQDPVWLKEAGLAAGKLAEDLKQWDTAIKLYERLMTMLPPLRLALERKIERSREQLIGGAN